MSVFTGHTSIAVSDMDRSLEFYCGLLGLHVSVDFGTMPAEALTRDPNSRMRFMLLADDDGLECVELFQFMDIEQRKLEGNARHEDFWSSHVCLKYDNVDEVYERLVAAGAEVDIPLNESGGAKFSYLYDPDGYMVELLAV